MLQLIAIHFSKTAFIWILLVAKRTAHWLLISKISLIVQILVLGNEKIVKWHRASWLNGTLFAILTKSFKIKVALQKNIKMTLTSYLKLNLVIAGSNATEYMQRKGFGISLFIILATPHLKLLEKSILFRSLHSCLEHKWATLLMRSISHYFDLEPK